MAVIEIPNTIQPEKIGYPYLTNLARTARRVPPMILPRRMNVPFSGQTDLAVDVILSATKPVSADPNARALSFQIGKNIFDAPLRSNFTHGWTPGTAEGDPASPVYFPSNHLKGNRPTGANVLSLDGHVEWHPWDPNTAFILGQSHSQSDPHGTPPPTSGCPSREAS